MLVTWHCVSRTCTLVDWYYLCCVQLSLLWQQSIASTQTVQTCHQVSESPLCCNSDSITRLYLFCFCRALVCQPWAREKAWSADTVATAPSHPSVSPSNTMSYSMEQLLYTNVFHISFLHLIHHFNIWHCNKQAIASVCPLFSLFIVRW